TIRIECTAGRHFSGRAAFLFSCLPARSSYLQGCAFCFVSADQPSLPCFPRAINGSPPFCLFLVGPTEQGATTYTTLTFQLKQSHAQTYMYIHIQNGAATGQAISITSPHKTPPPSLLFGSPF
ncbi:unnamed protein product, partial [Linum tenue]